MVTSRREKLSEVFADEDFDLEEPKLIRDAQAVQMELETLQRIKENKKNANVVPKPENSLEATGEKKDVPKSSAKYETLTKMTIRIEDEHRDMLDKVARVITRNREKGKEKERITANSVARAILTIFAKHGDRIIADADLNNIETDSEITERLEAYFSDLLK